MTDATTGQAFAGRLLPGSRPAVVVIDMVAAYYTPGSPLCLPSTDSVEAAGRIVAAAREAGVPVLHTVVAYTPEQLEELVFVRKVPALRHLLEGSELGVPMPQVAPAEGEAVLVKQHASAFVGTDLAERLSTLGVDTLVLVGVSTSGCVRATAVDAIARNLIPFVVRDAVGDRTEQTQEATLFDLQAKYAEVVGLDEALALLRG